MAEGPGVTVSLVRPMVEEEIGRLGRWADDETHQRLAATKDIGEYAALGDTMPGFFTQYAYVKYLLENGLRMAGPLSQEDLRMSERVVRAG